MRKDVYTFLQKQIVHIAYDGSFLYVVTIRTSYPRLWVNNRKIYVETNGNDWLFAITWGNCHGLTNRLTLLWYQFLWICRYHIFALKRHLIFNIFQERLLEIKLFILQNTCYCWIVANTTLKIVEQIYGMPNTTFTVK